jgi:hypothetical protein
MASKGMSRTWSTRVMPGMLLLTVAAAGWVLVHTHRMHDMVQKMYQRHRAVSTTLDLHWPPGDVAPLAQSKLLPSGPCTDDPLSRLPYFFPAVRRTDEVRSYLVVVAALAT